MSSPFNSINVDKWGTGDRNDCWWNIAKNQAGEGATDAEILSIMQSIVEYNEELSGKEIDLNDALFAGQQIFVPIEYSISEIQENSQTLSNEYNQLQSDYQAQISSLSSINSEVSNALNVLNDKQAAVTAIQQHNLQDQAANVYNELEEAKNNYQSLLQKQKEAQTKANSIQEQLNAKREEISETSEELADLRTELQNAKNENQKTIDKINSEIEALDATIEQSEEALKKAQDAAKVEAETTKLQDQAKELGAIDENGDTNKDWNPNSNALQTAAAASSTEEPNGEDDSGEDQSSDEVVDLENVTSISEVPQEFWDELANDVYSSDELDELKDELNSLAGVTSTSQDKEKALDVFHEILDYKSEIDTLQELNIALSDPENYDNYPIEYNGKQIDKETAKALSAQDSWGMSGDFVTDYKYSGKDFVTNNIDVASQLASAQTRLNQIYEKLKNLQFSEVAKRDPAYNEKVIDKIIDLYNKGGLYSAYSGHQAGTLLSLEDEILPMLDDAESMLALGTSM